MKSKSSRVLGSSKSSKKSNAKFWAVLPTMILVSLVVPIYLNFSLLNNAGVIEEPFLPKPSRELAADVQIFVTAKISCVLQFQRIVDSLEELQKCSDARASVAGINIVWDTPLPIPTNTSQFSPFYSLLSIDKIPPVQISRQQKSIGDGIGVDVSNTTTITSTQWVEGIEMAKRSKQKGSTVDMVNLLGSDVNMPGEGRTILQTTCAPIGDMRSTFSGPVPGTAPARNYPEPDFSGHIVHEQFHKDGYIGPVQSSLTAKELREAADALVEHRQKVRRAARDTMSGMSEAEASNYLRIYGKMHVAKGRCYAYDERCKRVVEDPAIVDTVKKVIGDDVSAYTIDLFDKAPGEIQPWHTDIEPYDRCYGKNVQLWLAVDGVTEKSTLQIATGSHHMPSLSWLFPEHLGFAKSIEEKHQYEQNTLHPCLESMDPTSRVISPVVNDGEFMILHSHLWHGSENTHNKTRFAIRIYYSHPECQPAAKFNYVRPNIAPFDPIPAVPTSLLVSGKAETWPNRNRVVQNFLHYVDIPPFIAGEKEDNRWVGIGRRTKTTTDAKSWSAEEIEQQWKTMNFNSGSSNVRVTRTRANFFRGPTPLFERLDLELLKLSPHEAAHGLESHRASDVAIIVEGTVKVFTIPKNSLLQPKDHKLGQIPELLELPVGSILFIDSHGLHTQIGGVNGGTFFTVKYDSRSPWRPPSNTNDSKGMKVYTPPLAGTFLDEPDFMQMNRVVAKVNNCIHEETSTADRETLIYVQSVPENMSLLSVLDGRPLAGGSVLYFPLGSSHSIQATWDCSGEKLEGDFPTLPSCIWIDLIASNDTSLDSKEPPPTESFSKLGSGVTEDTSSRKTATVIVEEAPSLFRGTNLERSIISLQKCENVRDLVEEVLVAQPISENPINASESIVWEDGSWPPVRMFNSSGVFDKKDRQWRQHWVGGQSHSLISINQGNDVSCQNWISILNGLHGRSRFYDVRGSKAKMLMGQQNWERTRDLPTVVRKHIFSRIGIVSDTVEAARTENKALETESAHILFGISGDALGVLAEFEVALKSILLNRPSSYDQLFIHVMADSKAFEALKELLNRTGLDGSFWPESITISVYNVDNEIEKWRGVIEDTFPVSADEATQRHTIGALFRMFANDILPPSVTHVVYMDTDVVIVSDLDPLFRQISSVAFQIGEDGCSGFMVLNLQRMKEVLKLAKLCKLERMLGLVNYQPDDQFIYRSLYVTHPEIVAQLPREWSISASNVKPANSAEFLERWPKVGMLHFNGVDASEEAYFNVRHPHPHLTKFPDTWGKDVNYYLSLSWTFINQMGESSCNENKKNSFVTQFH